LTKYFKNVILKLGGEMKKWHGFLLLSLSLILIGNICLFIPYLQINSPHSIYRRIKELPYYEFLASLNPEEKAQFDEIRGSLDEEKLKKFIIKTKSLGNLRKKLVFALYQQSPESLEKLLYYCSPISEKTYNFLSQTNLSNKPNISIDQFQQELRRFYSEISNPVEFLYCLYFIAEINQLLNSDSELWNMIQPIFSSSLTRKDKIKRTYTLSKYIFDKPFNDSDGIDFILSTDIFLTSESVGISPEYFLTSNPVRAPPDFLFEKDAEKIARILGMDKGDVERIIRNTLEEQRVSDLGTDCVKTKNLILLLLFHMPEADLKNWLEKRDGNVNIPDNNQKIENVLKNNGGIIPLLTSFRNMPVASTGLKPGYMFFYLLDYFAEIPGLLSTAHRDDIKDKILGGYNLEKKGNCKIIGFSQIYYYRKHNNDEVGEIDILAIKDTPDGSYLILGENKIIKSDKGLIFTSRSGIKDQIAKIEVIKHMLDKPDVEKPFGGLIDWDNIKDVEFMVTFGLENPSADRRLVKRQIQDTITSAWNTLRYIFAESLPQGEIPPVSHTNKMKNRLKSFVYDTVLQNMIGFRFYHPDEIIYGKYVIDSFLSYNYEIEEFPFLID
jgi:hypothetical protein